MFKETDRITASKFDVASSCLNEDLNLILSTATRRLRRNEYTKEPQTVFFEISILRQRTFNQLMIACRDG